MGALVRVGSELQLTYSVKDVGEKQIDHIVDSFTNTGWMHLKPGLIFEEFAPGENRLVWNLAEVWLGAPGLPFWKPYFLRIERPMQLFPFFVEVDISLILFVSRFEFELFVNVKSSLNSESFSRFMERAES